MQDHNSYDKTFASDLKEFLSGEQTSAGHEGVLLHSVSYVASYVYVIT